MNTFGYIVLALFGCAVAYLSWWILTISERYERNKDRKGARS